MPKGVYKRKYKHEINIGDTFGRITVVGENPRKCYLDCKCECGNNKTIRRDALLSGDVKSCGCLQSELASVRATKTFTKHGLSGTKIWAAYKDMIGRCYNTNFKNYKSYGALGVTVCDNWRGKEGFITFVADMGIPEKGDTLERISVKGNYEPTNCKWEPNLSVQGFNKRLNWNNSSGKTGIRATESGKWQAYIHKEGQWFGLGTYANIDTAIAVRRAAELEHYGFNQEDYE